tara:strand:- start:146 stop:433 length:288 start_codon:yes stop_codon:yes gene_type:complete
VVKEAEAEEEETIVVVITDERIRGKIFPSLEKKNVTCFLLFFSQKRQFFLLGEKEIHLTKSLEERRRRRRGEEVGVARQTSSCLLERGRERRKDE